MQSLKERFRAVADPNDESFGYHLDDELALEMVKQWLQDQYREWRHDEHASRGTGVKWLTTVLGDNTCAGCLGIGIMGGPGGYYDRPGKGKPCDGCDGTGTLKSELTTNFHSRDVTGGRDG